MGAFRKLELFNTDGGSYDLGLTSYNLLSA